MPSNGAGSTLARHGANAFNAIPIIPPYPACFEPLPHCHTARRWHSHWYVKTGYDYGYNEFFFADQADYAQFWAFVPQIGAPDEYI